MPERFLIRLYRSNAIILAEKPDHHGQSPSGVTAVDDHVLSSHERARITQHEQDGTAVLLWSADTAQHVTFLPLGAQSRVVLEVRLHHWSDDVSGTEHIDADRLAVDFLAPLHCQAPTELDDGALRRVVDGTEEVFVSDQATHRPDQDHAARSLVLLHLTGAAACGEVDTLKIDVHHLHVVSLLARGDRME